MHAGVLAQDRRVRRDSARHDAVPAGVSRLGAACIAIIGTDQRRLRRAVCDEPDGPEVRDRLLEREPHGLRAPRLRDGEQVRADRRRVPDVRPRHHDGALLRAHRLRVRDDRTRARSPRYPDSCAARRSSPPASSSRLPPAWACLPRADSSRSCWSTSAYREAADSRRHRLRRRRCHRRIPDPDAQPRSCSAIPPRPSPTSRMRDPFASRRWPSSRITIMVGRHLPQLHVPDHPERASRRCSRSWRGASRWDTAARLTLPAPRDDRRADRCADTDRRPHLPDAPRCRGPCASWLAYLRHRRARAGRRRRRHRSPASTTTLFEGIIVLDPLATFFKLLFLAIAIVVLMLLSVDALHDSAVGPPSSTPSSSGARSATCCSPRSAELFTIFLALQLTSLPLIVLIGYAKRDPRSGEASLKYLLLVLVSTAVLLYGMTLDLRRAGNEHHLRDRRAARRVRDDRTGGGARAGAASDRLRLQDHGRALPLLGTRRLRRALPLR